MNGDDRSTIRNTWESRPASWCQRKWGHVTICSAPDTGAPDRSEKEVPDP